MFLTLNKIQRRGGFSLVEMMVVLLIMASLATAAAVSVGTTQDKARADKTAAIGREIVETLERSDGLSFVSDFGRLPKNPDEVNFLFSPSIVDSTGTDRSAALYTQASAKLPSGIPSWVETAFGSPTLAAGWRGPYSQLTEFLDGWRNDWKVLDETGSLLNGGKLSKIESWGRDNANDGLEWQDKDLEFPLQHNLITENIDLGISVTIRNLDGTERTSESELGELHVLFFTPSFNDTDFLSDSGNNITRVAFEWNSTSSWPLTVTDRDESLEGGSPFALNLKGVTAGQRLIFLYATGSAAAPGNFAGSPRLVQLRPGSNHIDYTLNEQ